MLRTARLAGYFAAHAVWCVSDGGVLVPIVATENAEGSRVMKRIVDAEGYERGVERSRELLAANPDDAERGVLVFDGFVTLDRGRFDALWVEARTFVAERTALVFAVPYRGPDDPRGFAVHRPKLTKLLGDENQFEAVVDEFFAGVDEHEQGAAVWNDAADDSV